MEVTVNDSVCHLEPRTSVEELIKLRGLEGKGGVAVAVNGKVVRRPEWGSHILNNLDNVLIINAAYGG